VRLLAGNALTELSIENCARQLLDEPAAALLSDALRANTSLTALHLRFCGVWENPAAGLVLMNALAGHPRLRVIDLCGNSVHDNDAAAFAVLGALVAENTPSLQQLNVSHSTLGDAGMGPLVEALRQNTHLHSLDCQCACMSGRMSEAFARDRLLPAVRANASLRTLTVEPPDYGEGAPKSAREAAALVAARAQQSRA
jgi:Ran GTPase-activating protein (RanGAP) involved in mRNA processing and transport